MEWFWVQTWLVKNASLVEAGCEKPEKAETVIKRKPNTCNDFRIESTGPSSLSARLSWATIQP